MSKLFDRIHSPPHHPQIFGKNIKEEKKCPFVDTNNRGDVDIRDARIASILFP